MYALLIYSLKAGICLAVFYLFFKLLLSRETFHRLNRIVVLAALVLSFVLPLCVITVYRELPALPEVPNLPVPENVTAPVPAPATAEARFPWEKVAGGLFLLGAVGTLLWTLASLIGVLRLIRRGRREGLDDGSVLVRLDQPITPFSWGRYIVLSERDMAENGMAIVLHERAHLRLRHSADLLIADLAGCLQWFNPAMWLLRRELRAIHEYEADEAVLESGEDARQYQLLLIRKAAGNRWYSVANSFNHSKLKNRIDMMLRKKSSRWAGAKALFLLPLTGLALGAFARTTYVFPDDKSSLTRLTITNSIPADDGNKPLILLDGQEIASLDSLDADRIASISVLKDASSTALYGLRGINGVILVTSKDASSGKQAVSLENIEGRGSVVIRDSETGATASASEDGNETTIRIEGYRGSLNGKVAKVNLSDPDAGKVWVIDGRKAFPAEVQLLDQGRVVSMSVIKGAGVAAEYGDDMATSLIKITTKDAAKTTEKALQSAEEGIVSAREGLEAARKQMSRKEWRRVQKQLDKAQREIDAARSEMALEMAAARKEIEAAREYMSDEVRIEAQNAIAEAQKTLSDSQVQAELEVAKNVLSDPEVRAQLEKAEKALSDPQVRAKLDEAKKVLSDPEVRDKLQQAEKRLADPRVQALLDQTAGQEPLTVEMKTFRKIEGLMEQAAGRGETISDKVIVVRSSGKSSFGKGAELLFVIDGKRVKNPKNLDELFDPARVENITILKDSLAVEKYGKEAANGVILITTKK